MNPLALEVTLIERLRAALPDATVGSLANFVGSADVARHLPVVIVVPPAAELVDGGEGAFIEEQTWAVEIAVDSTPDRTGFNADYQEAGELMGKAIAALAGFAPGAPYQAVRYNGRPEPVELAGRVHFPLEFVVTFGGSA